MACCGVVWALCGAEWCGRAEVLARVADGWWNLWLRCGVLGLRGMLWRCVVCGVVPCRVAWCGVWCGCDVPRCRVTWCDVVVTWCGAVSCGAWCGAAWCGARQRGLAW